MKTITIINLILRDFQGGTFILSANGADLSVYADNGVGKTRLASAIAWLLFDKDSLGRSDFAIKNLDASGEAEHNLEHSVEGVLDVDGQRITLQKTYHEKWERKRGSATESFTGHTTKYAIDGVPCQKKEYQARIAEIAGDEARFRLLTSPTAFPALAWREQRAILFSVCGDVTDADVIAGDPRLAELSAVLSKYSRSKSPIDDHRKVLAARKTEINKKLVEIGPRIDEVRRSLPDIQGIDRAALGTQIAASEQLIADLGLRLKGVDTGAGIAELMKQVEGLNADIRNLESRHYNETMQTANRIIQEIAELEIRVRTSRTRVTSIDAEISRKTAAIDRINRDLDDLRAQWGIIHAEQFADTTATACAACGQDLPANRVADAREKALAAFNNSKADRLADNDRRGRQMSDEAKQLQADVDALTAEKQGIPSAAEHESRMTALTAERDAIRALASNYSQVPGRQDLIDARTKLEAQIVGLRLGVQADSAKINSELSVAKNALSTAREHADRFVRRESGEKRIDDLKADEKTLAAEFEKIESQLFLCDEFERVRVGMVNERINSNFEIVRFKLFQQNINGGIEPCCEITVNGVPFNSGLNNAGRIQAGCDIIRTLQRHYGLRAPVIIDNRESVVRLPDMGTQVISLIVSAADKVLRVERSADRQEVAA